MKKLRNKKTREICEFMIHKRIKDSKDDNPVYAPFNDSVEDWEDYEELEGYWYIDSFGEPIYKHYDDDYSLDKERKKIGNWFETKEEAEKAVEKFKAWKRLEDKGARFKDWFWDKNYGTCIILGDSESDYIDDGDAQNNADLDLLFGGEE